MTPFLRATRRYSCSEVRGIRSGIPCFGCVWCLPTLPGACAARAFPRLRLSLDRHALVVQFFAYAVARALQLLPRVHGNCSLDE